MSIFTKRSWRSVRSGGGEESLVHFISSLFSNSMEDRAASRMGKMPFLPNQTLC